MSVKKLILNRRLFLKCSLSGASTLVGLPFLESIQGNKAFAQNLNNSTPLRFVCMYHPNGVIQKKHGNNENGWAYFPDRSSETNFNLANCNLKALNDKGLRDQLTIIRGINTNGSGNAHMVGISNFLTGSAIPNDDIRKHRISFETHFGNVFAKNLPIKSMFMAGNPELDRPKEGSKYNNNLKNALSFSNDGSLRKPQMDQKSIFDQLFKGIGQTETESVISKRDQLKLSVLDTVSEARDALNRRINSSDRKVLDNYYTRIRELEKKLNVQFNQAPTGQACQVNQNAFRSIRNHNPNNRISDLTNVVDNAIELMVLAFACDRVRSFSFMFGGEAAGCEYSHIGVNRHFHNTLSHTNANNNSGNIQLHRRVDRYHVQKIGELAEKLGGIREANGESILHNSAIVSGSGLATGYNHSRSNIPFIVLGRAGGGIRGGRFLQLSGGNSNVAKFYSSLLRAYGASDTKFGDNGNGSTYQL